MYVARNAFSLNCYPSVLVRVGWERVPHFFFKHHVPRVGVFFTLLHFSHGFFGDGTRSHSTAAQLLFLPVGWERVPQTFSIFFFKHHVPKVGAFHTYNLLLTERIPTQLVKASVL